MSVVDMALPDKHLELEKAKKSVHVYLRSQIRFSWLLAEVPWEDSAGTEPAFLYKKLGFCS